MNGRDGQVSAPVHESPVARCSLCGELLFDPPVEVRDTRKYGTVHQACWQRKQATDG